MNMEKQGIENPQIIDYISATEDRVILHLYSARPWKNSDREAKLLEDKLNRYLAYVLDGFLATHYPQYKDLAVCLQLDCVENPHGLSARFFEQASHVLQNYGLKLAINLLNAEPAYLLRQV